MEENKNQENGQGQVPQQPGKKDDGKNPLTIFIWIGVIMVVVGIFAAAMQSSDRRVEEMKYAAQEEKADSAAHTREVMKEMWGDTGANIPGEVAKKWEVSEEIDPMTEAKSVWKSITSKNGINQDFPYEGYTQAHITVRKSPKYGTDVYVQIDRGQINGNEYRGTNYVTVRFDKTKAKRYYFNEAASGSSDIVFLQGVNDFIRRAKEAKSIKVEVPVFEYGDAFFEFEVDEPLEWP